MKYALSWSGGKDSTLALDRARRQGLDVALLFTIYDGGSGRIRFHGVSSEMVQVQADALGLDLLLSATTPRDYETVLLEVLRSLPARGIGGVVFGNIHLADIRSWYETRVLDAGLEHVEPLWGGRPAALVDEFLDRGYRTRIVSIDLERGDPAWVGRELDRALAAEIRARPGVDAAGERGEYHSFAFDGPLFGHEVGHRTGDVLEREGHRFIDIAPEAGL